MLNLIKVIHKDDLDSRYNLIENCSKTDARGKNYLVAIDKEDILDLAKSLGCKDDKAVKDIQKRIQLNQISDMILMALDSDEDTLTSHLIQEYGSMDDVLMHYNLIEITEEEKVIEDIVTSDNFLKDSLSSKSSPIQNIKVFEENTNTNVFDDFVEEDNMSSNYEDLIEDDQLVDYIPKEEVYVQKDEIESVKSIFKGDLEEPMNAYALQSNLDKEEDKTEVPSPYEFYNKEEEDLDMSYQGEVYMPPKSIDIKSLGNNSDGSRIVIKGKTRETEVKPEPVYEPQTPTSVYKEVKENQEIETPSNDDLLRVNLMFKKICGKLNLNFDDLEKEVNNEIELLRNPNFSEEELQLTIGRLISSGLLSGVESEFYVKSFANDPGTVTKILRGKLDMLKER